MKTFLLTPLIALALTTGMMAQAPAAGAGPFDGKIQDLTQKIDSGLAAGTLTKPDADDLMLKLGEIQRTETNEPKMTNSTRRILGQKLGKIEKELARKENGGKTPAGGADAGPTP